MKRKYINPSVRFVQCCPQTFFAASPNGNETSWKMNDKDTEKDMDPDGEDGSRAWNIGSLWDEE